MSDAHVLIVCTCGAVVLTCRCPGPHVVREVDVCGVCTCTSGIPVVDDDEEGKTTEPIQEE